MPAGNRDVTARAPAARRTICPLYVNRLLICCHNYTAPIELIVALIWQIDRAARPHRPAVVS